MVSAYLQQLRIDEFDYPLPDERIAKHPLPEREQSGLLIYDKGNIRKDSFVNIDQYIENQLLVYNDTSVIQARLEFRKPTGSRIEIFCLEPVFPESFEAAFRSQGQTTWKCMVGNLKKWKEGPLTKTVRTDEDTLTLSARLTENDGHYQVITFQWDPPDHYFGSILNQAGKMPIPPYLKREATREDVERYQTVYARMKGSVAAPTAGLHFTGNLIAKLKKKQVTFEKITLHVGAGTFQPVKSVYLMDHPMHTECISVSKKCIQSLLYAGTITSVGTTTLRTLESLYWMGIKTKKGSHGHQIDQWEPYRLNGSPGKKEALGALLKHMDQHNMDYLQGKTSLMIVPGYPFKMVDNLVTNFHQPKSTLLALVAAFTGNDWKKIYRYALENDFRFLSYGDGSLLMPAHTNH